MDRAVPALGSFSDPAPPQDAVPIAMARRTTAGAMVVPRTSPTVWVPAGRTKPNGHRRPTSRRGTQIVRAIHPSRYRRAEVAFHERSGGGDEWVIARRPAVNPGLATTQLLATRQRRVRHCAHDHHSDQNPRCRHRRPRHRALAGRARRPQPGRRPTQRGTSRTARPCTGSGITAWRSACGPPVETDTGQQSGQRSTGPTRAPTATTTGSPARRSHHGWERRKDTQP